MVNVKTDLSGKVFGKLTVLHQADDYVSKTGKPYATWLCKCECGVEKVYMQCSLTTGHTVSCGCHRRALMKEAKTIHGGVGTKLYNSWRAMKERCTNPHAENYPSYGGRGIRVCEEWLDYEIFMSWALTHGYKPGLTIDRVDMNGDYTPENCRWINQRQQCNNKRNNRRITFNGRTKTLSEWASEVGINKGTILNRIDKLGWDASKALTEPVKHGGVSK